MAGNNINFALGSHTWFGSLEFIVVGRPTNSTFH
jgi:hypothetical protein